MPKPSDQQRQALTELLGLGSHSVRKSHYPELLARLEDLEAERNRLRNGGPTPPAESVVSNATASTEAKW